MSKFPIVRIGELAAPQKGSFKIGPFGSLLKKNELIVSGIPVAGIENVLPNNFHPKYRKFITEEKYYQLEQFAILPDDVLVTTMGTIGRAAVVPKDIGIAVMDSHLFRMRVDVKKISPKYLCYALNGYAGVSKELNQKAKGAIMQGLNTTILRECSVPLPPLPEQQRIVSVLDEAFASIAQAKSNAERNLVNARELFESALQYEFENAGKDWEEKKIKEIGIAQTGTTPKTANKENYGDFIPFIKPADIDILGDGEIRYDNDGLSEEGLGNGRKILGGSVLMVCIGASIGKVGFVDRDVTCNQQINTLTVNPGLHPKFFYYALRTQGFYNQVIKNSAQMTLPIINKSKWENLTVHYPKSLAEQRAIVGRLEALSAETGRLEEIYQQKVESLEELKKSVLGKAFEGEL